jgi:hypothetical protein
MGGAESGGRGRRPEEANVMVQSNSGLKQTGYLIFDLLLS